MKLIVSIFLIFTISTLTLGQKVVQDIGDYAQIGLPISAIGISLIKGDKKGGIQLLKSFALETVLVIGLKRGINRTRPNGHPYSFPSGHTAVSFMSSTYLWKRYGWKYGLPSTIAAAFVGYSRFAIDDPAHFFSDVLAGTVIGVGSSWLFTTRQESNVEVDVVGDMTYLGLKLKVNLN